MHTFYIDKENGEVFIKVQSGNETTTSSLQVLHANTSDGASEKHVPIARVEGNFVHVAIGDIMHPMEEGHYITLIYLETNQGGQCKILTPNDQPEVTFALAKNEEAKCVYEYCNLHGLWKVDVE